MHDLLAVEMAVGVLSEDPFQLEETRDARQVRAVMRLMPWPNRGSFDVDVSFGEVTL